MRYFLLILVLLSPLSAFSQEGPVRESLIMVQKTACFGTCPAFTYYLFSDGRYIFKGDYATKFEGIYSGTTDPSIYREAITFLLGNDFNSFSGRYVYGDEECPVLATDSPSTNITVQSNGLNKQLSYYYGCMGFEREEELRTLIDGFSRILRLDEWY